MDPDTKGPARHTQRSHPHRQTPTQTGSHRAMNNTNTPIGTCAHHQASHHRRPTHGRLVLLTTTLMLAVTLLASPPALALPEGRVYEMVSPVYKGGYGALSLTAVAPDGNSVVFYSAGAFNGAPATTGVPDYLARRGASGWSTAPLMTPLPVLANLAYMDLSPSLDLELVLGHAGESSENFDLEEGLLLHSTSLPDTPAYWERIGQLGAVDKKEVAAFYEGATADFCHVLFTSEIPLLSLAVGDRQQLYEYDRGCDGEEPSLRLVGVNNRVSPELFFKGACAVDLGSSGHYAVESASAVDAISADGGEVFFDDCVAGATGAAQPHQLFVRVGGVRTLEVSRPLNAGQPFGGCVAKKVPGEVPCDGAAERPSADFAGASRDGSRVFFLTRASLTGTDGDSGSDVYMAQIGCPEANPGCSAAEREVRSLAQVSHDPNGGPADVHGVVRVAPDGSRVYFVAGGDLLTVAQREALQGEGRAAPAVGADNLYVYDVQTGGTMFVGDLCQGPELSGSVQDIHCPNTTASAARGDALLWFAGSLGSPGEAQTAGLDGRFLVFSTYAQLTADDIDNAKDVYRYDAQTGVLQRISIGENGSDSNGNREDGNEPPHYVEGEPVGGTETTGDATIAPGGLAAWVRFQYALGSRAVSEDGSRIVFTSAEPLSSVISNGLANAYEWHASPVEGQPGSVSPVSTGSAEGPVHEVVVSPDGLSVVFQTVQGLVSEDTDGLADIYDARLGGGFGQPLAERRPCEGDACQGPLTNPAPLLVPGSAVQAPAGEPVSSTHVKPRRKAKAKRVHHGKRKKRRRASAHAGSLGHFNGRSGR